jgi:hypothetical protein
MRTFHGHLQTLDWIIIAAYFGLLSSVAWWVVKNKNETADYFSLVATPLVDY